MGFVPEVAGRGSVSEISAALLSNKEITHSAMTASNIRPSPSSVTSV